MAIKNGFFKFTSPNIIQLPYFEFIMWGYYVIHTHRFCNISYPSNHDWKVIICALIFSQLFGIITDHNILLILTTSILLSLMLLYREKEDFIFVSYMCILGTIVEFIGITYNLWQYPDRNFQQAAAQFIIMWGAVGFFFRRIAGPFLNKS